MKPIRVRQSISAHPELLIESDRVHDQRVTFPVADRISVIAWKKILRVVFPIHVDNAEGVRSADIENINTFLIGHIDNLEPVRRDEFSRSSRGFAACMRFVLENLSMPFINYR